MVRLVKLAIGLLIACAGHPLVGVCWMAVDWTVTYRGREYKG